jgi:hypothetical protein
MNMETLEEILPNTPIGLGDETLYTTTTSSTNPTIGLGSDAHWTTPMSAMIIDHIGDIHSLDHYSRSADHETGSADQLTRNNATPNPTAWNTGEWQSDSMDYWKRLLEDQLQDVDTW